MAVGRFSRRPGCAARCRHGALTLSPRAPEVIVSATEQLPPPAAGGGMSRAARNVIAASFIGTTIEWYDFFLYGTASALVFNRLFFPSISPANGVLAAFATFAVGYA